MGRFAFAEGTDWCPLVLTTVRNSRARRIIAADRGSDPIAIWGRFGVPFLLRTAPHPVSDSQFQRESLLPEHAQRASSRPIALLMETIGLLFIRPRSYIYPFFQNPMARRKMWLNHGVKKC